jgi:hypothetical protein
MRRLHHSLAVERTAQGVDDPAHQLLAARNAEQLPGPADLIAFLDVEVLTEDHDTDRALFQIEDLAELPVGELQLLAGHGVGQAVDAGDPVTHLEDPSDFGQIDLASIGFDLLRNDRGYLVYLELHLSISPFDSVSTT